MQPEPDLVDALTAIVGAGHVRRSNELSLIDPGVDQDNLAAGFAVRPGSTDEVAAVLSACDRAGVSVITHGGRTGLARGAVSVPGQVVLMTDRFDGIDIDPEARVAIVGAGVPLQALQEAAARYGLSPGIDIAARGSATIGGMVSTNAGGMEAFRYGMMRQRLLGMEAVLADGTVLTDLARITKNNEGYDLRQLFCGAEGTLGVVTRVTMRLERADPPAETVLIGCANAMAALQAMRALEDTGGLLRAEIMWRDYAVLIAACCNLSAVLSFCDAPVYAIFDVAGGQDRVTEALSPLFEDETIAGAVLAKSAGEAADMWRIREDSFAANRAIAHPLWYDVSLPVNGLDAYIDALRVRLDAIEPDLTLHTIGHLADGNLHLTIGRTAPWPDDMKSSISIAVETGIKAQGGSISAEHGIGLDKLAALARNATPGKLDVMARLKRALDPYGTLNPGKVIP